MPLRYLLDTHILVRWLQAPKKLTREQARVLRDAVRYREAVAISAMTLLELAMVFGEGRARSTVPVQELLRSLAVNPSIQILPVTVEIAAEVAALGRLHGDPGDRAIVATARVHRLRLLTSDQRIIDSEMVPVVV